jgi:hypothetical protein
MTKPHTSGIMERQGPHLPPPQGYGAAGRPLPQGEEDAKAPGEGKFRIPKTNG